MVSRYLLSGWLLVVIGFVLGQALPVGAETNGVSATPAMGWSTWSFVRKSPSEAVVEAQALAMHNSGLQNHGFIYVNLDDFYYLNPANTVDAYGRWVVLTNTFPDGMAAVAAYVHSLGLKFGVYVTPGIPVAAYKQNTPILGTTNHAQDIVTNTTLYEANYNYGSGCMYYIDYTKPGAQAFINSWANMFAAWGVDYLKIDGVGDKDIGDIQAWSQALIQTGRPIHMELSNGLDVNNGSLWRQYANGWRIDGDVECYCSSTSFPLTDWGNVSSRFSAAPNWTQYGGSGGWNDLDSIEIGNGANDGLTAVQEQSTMTLWSMCCAPLLLGSDLTQLNPSDLPFLFNNNVLQIDQAGSIGAPLIYNTTTQVWRAAESDGSYAVAFFNLTASTTNISVTWAQLGFTNAAEVQDLWAGTDLGIQTNGYSASVPSDGATLYRIAPVYPAYRYAANAAANVIAGGAKPATNPELSYGVKIGYVGSGGTLTFNNVMAFTAGTYNVTFFYENGGGTRNANISVNGGSAIPLAFAGSGAWTALASETITVSLQAGSNSIAISNPTAYAPDFDSLVVQSAVLAPPPAPTGFAVAGGFSQATLSWLVSGGASGYTVKYGIASGIYTATNTTATAGLTVAGLTNGVKYYFVVAATNAAGASTNSSEVSVWVGQPAVPTNLVANAGNSQVNLQWSPSVEASSYNLERSTVSGGTYTIIASQVGTNFADLWVTNGTTYYYVVYALNSSTESAGSPEVSVTPGISNGIYEIICQVSGLALDDPNGGGIGTGTDQQPYSGTNQQWTIVSVGGGNYEITAANGYALSGPTAGAQLKLSSYTGAASQLWTFQANGSFFILHNAGSGQVMDDSNNLVSAGNLIDQWAANGGLNQNWILTTVGPGSMTWQGDGVANNWDVQTTANWINAGMPDEFYPGALVTFNDTGSSTPPVKLTTVLSPGGVTVNAAQNYTFGGSGQLSGEMSLTKSGTGTLFLQTTNTFTGNITVSGGTLVAGTTDNQNLPDGANGYTGSVNAAGAFGKPGTAITLGDANTTASNASPMLLIGGAFTVGHPIIIANQPTTGTYTMGGSVDANSSFTNLITLNQPLTIVQAVNAGTNALTISGGIVSTNGLQKLTFAGPGNVYVTTAAIGDGSGQVAVNVTGGTLTLSSANSYTGATTVTNGLLQVNGSTAAGSAVTIGAGGRLSGTGVINSSTTVQSGGALSPGNPVGILAIGSNLTLGTGSTTFVQVEHSPLTNNGVDITGTLNEGGTLNVTNSGGASFAAGDSFQLFSAASYSGSFAGIVLPALTGNLVWNTNTLKNSGTLSVVTLTPPTIAGVNIAGGQLVVNGSGGVNSWPFMLLAATNLTAGSWLPVATNQFDPSGNFILTNTLNPNSPQTFYKLQLY